MAVIKHLLLPLLAICCLLEYEVARASGDLARPASQTISLSAPNPSAD
ncbi:hypothetical protein [Pseudomonas sp. BN417]|nr:hypothetical protein [Pseudomonas sp. BN417]